MTLFSAHQAAPVHRCSAPQRICSKKSNFCFLFCVQERQQRQKAPKQIRSGACLLPCLFASAALHFRRHAVDSGMDATNVTGNTPRRIRPTVCMLTDQRSRHFARPKKKTQKKIHRPRLAPGNRLENFRDDAALFGREGTRKNTSATSVRPDVKSQTTIRKR